jgi:putative Holliday junction resolvase
MRVMAIDYGERRIGVAISDATATLARPLAVLGGASGRDRVGRVAALVDEWSRDEAGLEVVVIGMPFRLDGAPSEFSARVGAFGEALRARVTVPVIFRDERLSSHEAESRLAVGHRTWQARKARLDAAAAAVVLQDYLDERAARPH